MKKINLFLSILCAIGLSTFTHPKMNDVNQNFITYLYEGDESSIDNEMDSQDTELKSENENLGGEEIAIDDSQESDFTSDNQEEVTTQVEQDIQEESNQSDEDEKSIFTEEDETVLEE